MTVAQQANALLTYFVDAYKERYDGQRPVVNRYKDKWAFKDLLEDYNKWEVEELIDYYFKLDRPDHNLKWFLSESGTLFNSMVESKRLSLERQALLEQTEARYSKWRTEKSKS